MTLLGNTPPRYLAIASFVSVPYWPGSSKVGDTMLASLSSYVSARFL